MFKRLNVTRKRADDASVSHRGTVAYNGEGCWFDLLSVTNERGTQYGLLLVKDGTTKFIHCWGTFKDALLEELYNPEKEAIAKEFMAALKEAS